MSWEGMVVDPEERLTRRERDRADRQARKEQWAAESRVQAIEKAKATPPAFTKYAGTWAVRGHGLEPGQLVVIERNDRPPRSVIVDRIVDEVAGRQIARFREAA